MVILKYKQFKDQYQSNYFCILGQHHIFLYKTACMSDVQQHILSDVILPPQSASIGKRIAASLIDAVILVNSYYYRILRNQFRR
jgi:hypothetical protein